jgi:hypothetical protein
MIDLKAELIRSVTDRIAVEIKEVRIIGEDLKARNVDEVTLTRIEAHATKLEVFNDMLREVLTPLRTK